MLYRVNIVKWTLAVLALAALSPAAIMPAQAQSGYDRQGGDYLHFEIRSGDPAVCAARCESDRRCRAWAFSYPRTEDTLAVCWLKNKVPPRSESECCITGVRGAGVITPLKGPLEIGIDRRGGDYRHFDLPSDSPPTACNVACEAEDKCRAWTYVRPGYVGAAARCYLKNKITRPRRKPCCISGVVR